MRNPRAQVFFLAVSHIHGHPLSSRGPPETPPPLSVHVWRPKNLPWRLKSGLMALPVSFLVPGSHPLKASGYKLGSGDPLTWRRWGRWRGGTRCRWSWRWTCSRWTRTAPSVPWCTAGCPTAGKETPLKPKGKEKGREKQIYYSTRPWPILLIGTQGYVNIKSCLVPTTQPNSHF